MKLQNILVAGLSLLAFIGCSKDSQPVKVTDMADAKLNISLKASGPASSKADGDDNALEGEMDVNSITVLSFTSDGSEILVEPFWTNANAPTGGVITTLNVPTKATNAIIVVLANVPENAFGDVGNFTDFQNRLAQLETQKQTEMTMSAQIITASKTLEDGDNFIGYSSQSNINNINEPLELTRLAARIELVNLYTNFGTSKLAGRTVRINSVRLANIKTASHFSSHNYWGAIMADGNLNPGASTVINQTIDGNTVLENSFRTYVMENTDAANATQIVVNATLLKTTGYQEETKEFAATINLKGSTNDKVKHSFIKRNFIYRVKISFGPTSFEGKTDEEPTDPDIPVPPTPDNGDLTVSVEVAGWGPVNQHVVVE